MKKLFLIIILSIIGILSCDQEETIEDISIPADQLDAIPYQFLSEYGLFSGELKQLEPNNRVYEYDLNMPLFTDYAYKYRTVFVPQGETVGFEDDNVLNFPVGTIITKTFYYPFDFREPVAGRNIIETRLLVRHIDEWKPYLYIWNEDQTDAELEVVGRQLPIEWINEIGESEEVNYVIPNENECKNCHTTSNVTIPIGPKGRNLTDHQVEVEGQEVQQLTHWKNLGWLTGLPDSFAQENLFPTESDISTDLNKRARAYLDVNCAHCHNPHANANNSGLFLNYNNEDAATLGICKTPIATGGGSGGLLYSIVPGNANESIMVFRMNSVELDEKMPEIGRSNVHREGVKLIQDWINAMPPDDCL